MISKKLVALAALALIAATATALALTGSFVVILQLRPAEPVNWSGASNEVVIDIAPAQTYNMNKYLGQIRQRSDKVKYCISVEGLSEYKLTLRLFSVYSIEGEAYTTATPMGSTCAVITKKDIRMNEIPIDITLQGWVKAPKDLKEPIKVTITITAEPLE